jgi:succinate dehydrogenase / fumarate reductase cytochrome b subunit
MALTGLALCGFLVIHLAGNLLLFAGAEKFNGYARFLEENPLLIPAEIVLFLTFALHIYLGVRVSLENRRARPDRYAVQGKKGGRTLASSTLWISGGITLVFLVLHLIHFKLADRTGTTLYHIVVTAFHSLPYSAWYVLAVCVLGLHVGHGMQSACRSLGLHHPKYAPAIRWASYLFGALVAIGYASLPIWAYLFTRNPA